ncbi:MAG: hypothetical protein AAB036_09465 [Elusimicrobiota bacterium]
MKKILAVAVLSLAVAGNAESSGPPAILSDLNSFSTVTKNWRYDCWQPYLRAIDPEIDVHLREFMEPVILDGLRRLHRINPDLVEESLEAKGGMPLLVTCGQNPGKDASMALSWDRSQGLFKIGSLAHDIAVHHSPEALAKLGRSQDASRFTEQRSYYENTILHEYLHALEWDNMTDDDHRAGITRQSLREKDVVYACSAQAYPCADCMILRRANAVLFNTKTACESCARAVWNKGGGLSVLDDGPQGDRRAAQACGNFRSEDFQVDE